ncbi:MAG: CotH kinase family protein [Clostridia bacterium]|nr:CotH kinase family protein [Clostridia bacterium]
MKRSFYKLTAILLLLITLLGSLPAVALAADEPALWVSPIEADVVAEERPISSIKWWYDDDDAVYYLFLPTACDASYLQVWLENAVSCAIDGTTFTDGATVGLTLGSHTVNLNGTDYPVVVMQSSSIGTMYITTESGSMNYIHKAKGNKESGAMKMLDAEGKVVYDNTLSEIKGRGNATWSRPKKPYQIKLDKKTDLTGDAGKNKTWILLANYLERSLMRNTVIYDMAYTAGLPNTSLSTYVDLYCNGEYRGTYQLTEKVHINDDRIEINNLEDSTQEVNELDLEDYPTFGPANASVAGSRKGYEIPNNPEDITGGYLLELDHPDRYTAEASGFVTDRGQAVVIKEPEYASRAQVDYIANYFQEFEDAVFAEDGICPKSGKYYYEYFDLTSLARKYIIEEITKNIDADVTSQYYYKPSDTESTVGFCGPIWDYDNSMGNHGTGNTLLPEGLYAAIKKNYIYKNLYKKESFLNAVYAEWEANYRPLMVMTTQDAVAPEGSELRTITEYYNMLKDSAAMNFTYWENINSVDTSSYNDTGDTYEEHVEFVRSFLSGRIAYLDTVWDIDNIGITAPSVQAEAAQSELVSIQSFGTISADTYAIGSEADLRKMAELVSAGYTFQNITLLQVADITLTKEFIPAGNGGLKFMGNYNGQGYQIHNLQINQPDNDGVGLFAYANTATFTDVHIASGSIMGDNRVGSIAGYGDGCTFTRCSNGASITSDNTNGKDGTGGLAGVSRSNAVFVSCYNTGKIDGCNPGGLSGWGQGNVSLTNCWSSGIITDRSNNGKALVRTNAVLDFSTCYYYEGCGETDPNGAASFDADSLTNGSLLASLNGHTVVWEQGESNPVLKTPEQKNLMFITLNRYHGDTLLDTSIQYRTAEGSYTLPSYRNIIKSVKVNGVATSETTFSVTENMVIDLQLSINAVSIQQWNGKGNYFIATTGDLLQLMALSRSETLQGSNFFLLSDIDAATLTLPGGTFGGTLNGLSFTIYGLNTPLFTSLTKTAEVRKLSFAGGNRFANGIFGAKNEGRVIEVSLRDTVTYGTEAGGIVKLNSGEISGCTVDGYVLGSKSASGIAAINNGTVKNCINHARIVAPEAVAAGITAANYGKVEQCVNVGALYGAARHAIADNGEAKSYYWDWHGGEGAATALTDVELTDPALPQTLDPAVWTQTERFPAIAKSNVVRGDANGDFLVSLADALRILRYLNDLIGEEEIDLNGADLNGDGFSMPDAIRLLQYLNGPLPVATLPEESRDPNSIKMISYNIRCANDGENKMLTDRMPRLMALLDEYDPDIIGLQEVVPTSLSYLEAHCGNEYTIFNQYRAVSSLESTPILYKTAKYNELARGYFWLSDTPEVESKGWGASHYRICNWVKLEDKATGKIFLFFNSHFHGSDTFHAGAAPLITARAAEQGGFTEYPVILSGDFNAETSTNGYKEYTVNGSFVDINGSIAGKDYDNTPTTGGYNPGPDRGHIIDYIMISENGIQADTYQVLNKKLMGGYISDHNGIYTELTLE